jgi:hypothetical protein
MIFSLGHPLFIFFLATFNCRIEGSHASWHLGVAFQLMLGKVHVLKQKKDKKKINFYLNLKFNAKNVLFFGTSLSTH